MKKFLILIFFLLSPLVGYAIECVAPMVCTQKASEMCSGKNLKLLGTDECLECGCPSGQELVSDGSCCPLGNVHTETATGQKVCDDGCPEGEEMDDNGICCPSGRMLKINGTKKCCGDDERSVASGGDSSKSVCCSTSKIYEEEGLEKCCETNLITFQGQKICCQTGEHGSKYTVNKMLHIKCCPDGQEALDGSGDCCRSTAYAYPATYREKLTSSIQPWKTGWYLQPKEDYYYCCDGELVFYTTLVSGTGTKVIRQCCRNGATTTRCASGERGGVISLNGLCQCGCQNNYDCNLYNQKDDVIYYCQADHTCAKSFSFDISGTEVEIQDFEGGELTRGKIERLVENVREDLLASTGYDKVKIILTGTLADNMLDYERDGRYVLNNGFSSNGEKMKIVIRSGYCTETISGFQCQATIVHENVHRVDKVKQPMWYVDKKPVTSQYQSCLTEINAQATGALKALRSVYENCYRYQNGQAYSTCAPSMVFDKQACKRCQEASRINEDYAEKYMTYEWAEKYFSNPSWSQFDCNGLKAQLEEDFANSSYAERSYFGPRRNKLKKILTSIPFFVRTMVSKFKNASYLDQGLFGMISRTGFLWNSNPSPNSVSGIAELYAKNANPPLCMSSSRFANHPKIKLGAEFDDINELEEAYAFVLANPECGANFDGNSCQKKLDCVTNLWRKDCWAVQEWASHIGEVETYTD